jgi:hypothetical protein
MSPVLCLCQLGGVGVGVYNGLFDGGVGAPDGFGKIIISFDIFG